MSKKVKAFLYNLICFAPLFLISLYLIEKFTGLTGWLAPITAFVVGTILAPKFQAIKTSDGEKLFMKWLFIKEVKEIK